MYFSSLYHRFKSYWQIKKYNSEEFQIVDAATAIRFFFKLLLFRCEAFSPSVICVKSSVKLNSAFQCRSFPNNYWDKFIKRKVRSRLTLIWRKTVFFSIFPFSFYLVFFLVTVGRVLQRGFVTKVFIILCYISLISCVGKIRQKNNNITIHVLPVNVANFDKLGTETG